MERDDLANFLQDQGDQRVLSGRSWKEIHQEMLKTHGFYYTPSGDVLKKIDKSVFDVLNQVSSDDSIEKRVQKTILMHPAHEKILYQLSDQGLTPLHYLIHSGSGKLSYFFKKLQETPRLKSMMPDFTKYAISHTPLKRLNYILSVLNHFQHRIEVNKDEILALLQRNDMTLPVFFKLVPPVRVFEVDEVTLTAWVQASILNKKPVLLNYLLANYSKTLTFLSQVKFEHQMSLKDLLQHVDNPGLNAVCQKFELIEKKEKKTNHNRYKQMELLIK